MASQIGKAFDDAEYLGSHPRGACTYCHLKKIELKEDNEIECVTCGAQGRLIVASDGVMEPVWNQDCDVSSITMAGKRRHLDVVENGSKRAPLALKNPEFRKKKDAWTSLLIPQVVLPSAPQVEAEEMVSFKEVRSVEKGGAIVGRERDAALVPVIVRS